MKILGLAGRAGVGKDFLASLLRHHLVNLDTETYTESFANPIKMFTEATLGISPAELEQRKRLVKPEMILGGMTARRFMQVTGTEFGRQMNSMIWVNSLMARLEKDYPPDARIIITDVRFSNEADFIKRFGGKVCRIFGEVDGSQYDHDSEALPFQADFDFTNDKKPNSARDFLHTVSLHYSSFLLP